MVIGRPQEEALSSGSPAGLGSVISYAAPPSRTEDTSEFFWATMYGIFIPEMDIRMVHLQSTNGFVWKTTPAKFHVRKDQDASLREVRMLHRARHHRHVLLLYGFTCLPTLDDLLEPEKRLALVTERTWGSVRAALQMGCLVCQSALTIAAQVASALEHLDAICLEHGAVRAENVALIADPRNLAPPLIAKLMNFYDADETSDEHVPANDMEGYVVFNYNMLVKNYEGTELDGAHPREQAHFASSDAAFADHFPYHSALFKSLCSRRETRAGRAILFARIASWTHVPPREMSEPRGTKFGHLVMHEGLPIELAQPVADAGGEAAGPRVQENAQTHWHDTLPSLSDTRSDAFGLGDDENLPSFNARSVPSEGLKTAKTLPSSYSDDRTRYVRALLHYLRDDANVRKSLEGAGFRGVFEKIPDDLDWEIHRTFDLREGAPNALNWIFMKAREICFHGTEAARRNCLEECFQDWNRGRTEYTQRIASLMVSRFYVDVDNIGTKNPVYIGRVRKDVKDWQSRARQTLFSLYVLHRYLPRALQGNVFLRILNFSMDPQPEMRLPGTEFGQNEHRLDSVLSRQSKVTIATHDLRRDCVEFLEATYLISLKWFGLRINRDDLKAQIQRLKPTLTLDP
jgi:hypothetical protein